MDERLQHHLNRLLSAGMEPAGRGGRLAEDGLRLWGRVQRFVAMGLIGVEADRAALELACFGLQLPLRAGGGSSPRRLGPVSLKERAEQAAELLIGGVAEQAGEELIERTVRLLRELPLRSPALPEARLLADAVNLDDFGLIGLVLQAMHLARQNAGVSQVADGFYKRQEYGYWAARLKDGFHFEPVRQMAQERLKNAQQAAGLLRDELNEQS